VLAAHRNPGPLIDRTISRLGKESCIQSRLPARKPCAAHPTLVRRASAEYDRVKTNDRKRTHVGHRIALIALCGLAPAMMGGCPEFRNDAVTAVETAVRGLLDAAVDLYFDQFRTDDAR
jgi:hypothetical protein